MKLHFRNVVVAFPFVSITKTFFDELSQYLKRYPCVATTMNHFYSAAASLAMQSAVLATAISSVRLSVCLSVCQAHAGTLFRRIKIGSCDIHCEVAKTL